jgi:hypothetical protein
MSRKLGTTGVAVAVVFFGLVGTGGVAAAAPTPLVLDLSQGAAFTILGHSCGGIQETVYANGFDATTGFPTGVVDLQTACGGSGRGGGYHSTTYTASADVMWDFTATEVSTAVPATGAAAPGFAATDSNGNQIYDSGSSAYLLLASGFTPTPRVTGISTTEGPAGGGTPVVISGTGFTGATQVSFGTTPATSFTITDDNSITAMSPVAPAGQFDVTVTSAGGTDATGAFDLFTFVVAPTITSLRPASGPLQGGNQVVITGTGLAAVTSVSIGGNYAPILSQSDTSITVTAPSGEGVDNQRLTVSSVGGTASAGYAYKAPALCGSGCVFTSPGTASGTTGVPFSFTVSASGGVTPTFTEKGKLPKGITFVDNFDGTATLSGTPVNIGHKVAAGTYRDKIKAIFTYGTATRTITQALTLTVS